MSPLSIAAIIPTYNYAHGINQAIASALNQTLPALEINVVDDGSTDGTRNILDAYGSRIKSLYQQNRGGERCPKCRRSRCQLRMGRLFRKSAGARSAWKKSRYRKKSQNPHP